jgi:hypothetical protein
MSGGLPQAGFIRACGLLSLTPISHITHAAACQGKIFLAPIKLSKRITAWCMGKFTAGIFL